MGGSEGSTVYQAGDLNFPDGKRKIAIKEIQIYSRNQAERDRRTEIFQQRAYAISKLNIPVISKLLEFWEQNDLVYLAMEWIEGRDLELYLKGESDLHIDQVIKWAICLCDALDYLHHIHPDPIVYINWSPHHLIIDQVNEVKLVDFGIPDLMHAPFLFLDLGSFKTIPRYYAPETEVTGLLKLDPQSDIYGLGAILHYVLTRVDPRPEPPYSFSERSIWDYNLAVPYRFVQIIEKALELLPQNRWQSAIEMKAALEML